MKIFYDKPMLKIMLQFISRDEFVPFITEMGSVHSLQKLLSFQKLLTGNKVN